MSDYILNLVINILLMVIAVYSIKELIYDNSRSDKFYKKIKNEGWILIVFALLSISFNLLKDIRSENRQTRINNEKAVADSLLQLTQLELKTLQLKTQDTILNEVEKTYLKSIAATNEVLANYNLEITDSLRRVINTLEINSITPQLSFEPLSKNSTFAYMTKENEIEIFWIKFNSYEGTSYNISLKCYFVDEQNNKILGVGDLTKGKQFLTQNVTRGYSLIINDNQLKNYDEILVLILGSFTRDPVGKDTIPFNGAFHFNFKENELISKVQLDFENIKNRLNIDPKWK